jgi:predicted O-methyltransferase YrrM
MTAPARPSLLYGFIDLTRSAFALLAALQLDLFTPLASRPLRADELATVLHVDAERLSQLLYVLVLDGLLTVEDGRFANSEQSDQLLVRGKPTYIGDAHTLWADLSAAHLKTAASIRTGIPQARHDYGQMSADALRTTLGGIHPTAVAKGRALAVRSDFTACRSLLDVGGGTGGLSIALAEAYPLLQTTIAELPGVIPLAQQYVAEAGMQARIDTVAVDLLHEAVPGQFDVAVLNIFLGVLSRAEAQAALRHVSRSIRRGGAIYIIGNILDDSRLAPAGAVRANITSMNIYDGGQSYTEGEHRAWLTDAGFVAITREEELIGNGLIRARKAG